MSFPNISVPLPLGGHGPIGLEAICARVIPQQDRPYRHCAPGVLYEAGGRHAASTIPAGFSQSSATGAETGLYVAYEVADETAMDIALARLLQEIDGGAPDGFAVEASSSHLSFGDLAERAAPFRRTEIGATAGGDGCGCGCTCGGDASAPSVVGSLRVGLQVSRTVHWSAPVPALLYPRLLLGIDLDLDGKDDESCSGFFVFDCHAHWQWFVAPFNPGWGGNPRFTVCHNSGTCARGTCQTNKGTPAPGWRNCTCR